ncbi:sigma-70 family RNA polymerase sigma factor [Actinoplanes sp. NPDC026670]|uniref:sigma-70 family RNA polymerase sigma factor n=1 Tax=Actinoplanes sp. NPDC026670 TaxID=3154700 RepID=UPI0033C7DB75
MTGLAEPSDAHLVISAQQGDSWAAEALLSRYLPLISNVIGRALGGHPDTDDLVQETMLRALQGIKNLREPDSFRSWLVSVAIRQVKDWGRAHRRAIDQRALLSDLGDVPDAEVDVAAAALERADREKEHQRFLEATRWVSPQDRSVLRLWWQELNGQLTRAELAQAMNLSPTHAAVRIQRMREHLARVHTVLTAYQARPRCPGLTAAARGWDEHADARLLRRMSRHVTGCEACIGVGRGLLPPESQIRVAGLALLPALLAQPVTANVAVGILHRIAEVLSVKRAALLAASTAGATVAAAVVLLPATPREQPIAQPPLGTPPAVVSPGAPATSASASVPVSPSPDGATPGRKIYVARNGDDQAAGTEGAPLGTVNRAIALARPGDTVLLRDGFHRVTGPLEITTDGTAEAPITLTNYPGEKPSIDAGQVPSDGPFIRHRADHWIVSSLDVWGAAGDAYACISCSQNVLRNLTVHGNAGSALTLGGAGASGNKIIDSDFYDNADPDGRSADGITFVAGSGGGNLVGGCRMFDNVDDGIAVEGFTGALTIDGSWSYGNGINRWNLPRVLGTGHGFELGDGAVPHLITRSAAWKNNGTGFLGGGAAHELTRNTAFRNAGDGFAFASATRLQANLALGNDQDIRLPDGTKTDGNSWDDAGWSTAALVEIDPATAEAGRAVSGALPVTRYLTNSRDAGTGAPMTPYR